MKIRFYLYIMVLALATSCQKEDINGPLDGMWQLTSLERRSTKEVLLDKQNQIYWHFKLQLMKAEQIGHDPVLLTFRYTGNELQLLEARQRPKEDLVGAAVPTTVPDPDAEGGKKTVVGFAAVKRLAIPESGRLQIESISDDRMVLTSGDSLLTFRKY